ncbi:unnamed protein product [Cuscuta campestris]|uniref:Uncharacterized protein n=1 Tax=Cuscuta campestris TaxID=132261 RepID=A0A484KNQ6_9ASTE|nr:unnamed protein product [Cuscuta campestris]
MLFCSARATWFSLLPVSISISYNVLNILKSISFNVYADLPDPYDSAMITLYDHGSKIHSNLLKEISVFTSCNASLLK